MSSLTTFPHQPAVVRVATCTHPLIHAAKWIAADLVSTLAFVGLYALTHSALAATVVGLAAGVVQIAYVRHRHGSVDAMQWTSLGLVVFFGAASLLTHDGRFIMVKPTLIYAAIGLAMLKRGWMGRYMSQVVLARSADLVNLFGYVWAGAMFATAALNLAIVATGDRQAWVWFISVFPLASKLALLLVQYGAMRWVTVARSRRMAFAPA